MFVVLFCIVPTIVLRQDMLIEPDLWWHIKTGLWIWQHRSFPVTDPFSYTYAGHAWMAKEWLSQLLYAGAWAAGGWSAATALGVAAIGIFAALLYWAASESLKPSVAASVVIVCLLLTSITFTLRPHLFTLPLLVVWTHALFTSAQQGRAPRYWLLLALVLWANLHAAFTMGLVIAAIAFLDFIESHRLSRRGPLAGWVVFLVLCPVAAFVHPYLYQPMLATWQVIFPKGWAIPLTEWQAFNAQAYGIHALVLMGLVFAALTSGFRLGYARSLLVILLLYLFLAHMRYAFFLFPVLVLVAAPEAARQFPRLATASWRSGPLDPVEKGMSAGFWLLAHAMGGAMALALAAQVFLLRTTPPETVAATDALAFARSHGLKGHVMNYYNFGGPLILEGIPTFIDGRTDQLFQGDFAEKFVLGPADGDSLARALDQYDVRWTLMPPSDPRVKLLDKLTGWQRTYADRFAVIHQRQ